MMHLNIGVSGVYTLQNKAVAAFQIKGLLLQI